MPIESEVAPVLAKMVYGVGYCNSLLDGTLHMGLDKIPGNKMMPELQSIVEEIRLTDDDAHEYRLRVRFIQACFPELMRDTPAPTAEQVEGILKAYAP